MAHNVETMAYSGEVPWHGLGVKVPADLTSIQMLQAAKLDWQVNKVPAYIDMINKDGLVEKVYLDNAALVRETDSKVLDVVSSEWNTVQNQEAFEFFDEFIADGSMEMHTAGSLQGGKIVWVLAKVNGSFELFGGDLIEPYLLFSNFHKYGFSTDVRFSPIRVVCNNTLNMAIGKETGNSIKVSHRRIFDPLEVKSALGIAVERMAQYQESAKLLGTRRAKDEDVIDYFTRIFPVSAASKKAERHEKSRNAVAALKLLCEQPGTEFAEGSWWQAYNAVSYFTDHVAGRNVDTRLTSSWYGPNRRLKIEALDLAVEMAEKSGELVVVR
jgi:phage/plasmid-like protein (TIGR03299 family)